MEGKEGKIGKWGFRVQKDYQLHPINPEGWKAGGLCRAWLGLPERVLFPWKSELQMQSSPYVDLGKEIWKTSALEEPGFPKEPCLTLKGGVDTTQLRDANWRSCASWDEDGN